MPERGGRDLGGGSGWVAEELGRLLLLMLARCEESVAPAEPSGGVAPPFILVNLRGRRTIPLPGWFSVRAGLLGLR